MQVLMVACLHGALTPGHHPSLLQNLFKISALLFAAFSSTGFVSGVQQVSLHQSASKTLFLVIEGISWNYHQRGDTSFKGSLKRSPYSGVFLSLYFLM